jgi:hypothetical protein
MRADGIARERKSKLRDDSHADRGVREWVSVPCLMLALETEHAVMESVVGSSLRLRPLEPPLTWITVTPGSYHVTQPACLKR